MMVNAKVMTIVIMVKYIRSILAALIVSNSTPKAGNYVVRVLKFLAMSKIAMIPQNVM